MAQLDYYLFIYSESLAPGSGIPLGVIAHDGRNALVRAIGLSDNWDIDLAPYKALSGRASALAWVYETWLVTFKEVIGETRNDPAGFERVVQELGSNPVGFSVLKDGYIEVPDDGTPEGAVDHLFRELVIPFFPALA